MAKKKDAKPAPGKQPIGKGKPYKAPAGGPALAVREPAADDNATTGAGDAKPRAADPDGKSRAEVGEGAKNPVKAKAERIKAGHLYSAAAGELFLQAVKPGSNDPTGEQGDRYELADGVTVTVNGTKTDLGVDDLKRGDRVDLTGDPVHTVAAAR